MTINIDVVKSTKEGKKYDAIIHKDNGKTKTVSFGAAGMSDYTKHKDEERKANYISRHKAREDWSKAGYDTAGFMSRWILWNKPSLRASINDTNNRFNNLNIKMKV